MKYRLTGRAEADIVEIYRVGAAEFGFEQAERYHAGLTRTFEFLAKYPRAARERRELSPPVRVYPYRSHLIVYQIVADGVLIVALRHGHEDWQASPSSG